MKRGSTLPLDNHRTSVWSINDQCASSSHNSKGLLLEEGSLIKFTILTTVDDVSSRCMLKPLFFPVTVVAQSVEHKIKFSYGRLWDKKEESSAINISAPVVVVCRHENVFKSSFSVYWTYMMSTDSSTSVVVLSSWMEQETWADSIHLMDSVFDNIVRVRDSGFDQLLPNIMQLCVFYNE